jgi:hypothetical protein
MNFTAYDLYRYLDAAIEYFLDSIAIKEDPTKEEREQYENMKFWRPSTPDDNIKEILESLVLSNKEKQENESKE